MRFLRWPCWPCWPCLRRVEVVVGPLDDGVVGSLVGSRRRWRRWRRSKARHWRWRRRWPVADVWVDQGDLRLGDLAVEYLLAVPPPTCDGGYGHLPERTALFICWASEPLLGSVGH